MFKKILCLLLALVTVAGLAVIGASAADETKFYFELPSDWGSPKAIYCHIYDISTGTELAAWQTKKEKCTLESDGRYSYDPVAKKVGIADGVVYGIIFSNDAGMETYTTLMSTACYGDALYCNDTKYENPVDSSKTSRAAFWRNKNAAEYGPLMQITSIGNLVGTCMAPGATGESMFKDFLTNNLTNAQTYSGKDDLAIIDDMAKDLGLGKTKVEKLIKDTGVTVKWDAAKSGLQDADDTTKLPSNPGAIGSGQEMTIVYIAVAMMVAAAGVVFFARKKRVTE